MTNERITQVIAEADGKTNNWVNATTHSDYHEMPQAILRQEGINYLTSLDAIVPVVVKWCDSELGRWQKFFGYLGIGMMSIHHQNYALILKKKPEQICHALVRAMGKYE